MAWPVHSAVGVAKGEEMTSDLDIYRSAKLLIDRHGDDAVIEAAMMADNKAKT